MLGGPIARSIFCASALVALEKTLIRLDLVAVILDMQRANHDTLQTTMGMG